MRRCIVAALLVLLAAPAGAAWPVSGASAGATAALSRVSALPAPTVTPTCLAGGSIGLDIRWSASESWLTGYEVWRSVSGSVSKVVDVPAGTRQASDVQVAPSDLRYWIVSRAGAWQRTGVTRIVEGLPVCTLSSA